MPNEATQFVETNLLTLKRGTVTGFLSSGEALVCLDGVTDHVLTCDYLSNSNDGVLCEGNSVLVATPDGHDGRGCVLGSIGFSRKARNRQLVVEADEELIIQCGKGSIKIRKDGKILIKGLDIVSHAKGANRIRGGSVELN